MPYLREFLAAKIDNVLVTGQESKFCGGIFIDEEIMIVAGLQEYQKVIVQSIKTGKRQEAYIRKIKRGSAQIVWEGSEFSIGDKVSIIAYEYVMPDKAFSENSEQKMFGFPRIVVLDGKNGIADIQV